MAHLAEQTYLTFFNTNNIIELQHRLLFLTTMGNIISFRNNKHSSISCVDIELPVMNADTDWVFVDDELVEHNWIFSVDGNHHCIIKKTTHRS